MKKETKSSLEFACMDMKLYKENKKKGLSEAFLRKPYQYTIAETKDDTQGKLHEFDYRN